MGRLLDNVSIDTAANGAPLPPAAWGGLMLMLGLFAARIRRKLLA
jgi:MYXO-CTERM domain-containing protein